MRFKRALRFMRGTNEARASPSRLLRASHGLRGAHMRLALPRASVARLTAPLATLVATTETSAYNHATFPLRR